MERLRCTTHPHPALLHATGHTLLYEVLKGYHPFKRKFINKQHTPRHTGMHKSLARLVSFIGNQPCCLIRASISTGPLPPNIRKASRFLLTAKGEYKISRWRSHLNLLRKYKMGDFCIFVLPQTISYKSPICTKYSAKIQ